MTMTPKLIGERLLAITNALVEKIDAQPWMTPSINITNSGMCSITIYRDINHSGNYTLGTVIDDTFEGLLAKAAAFIEAMPNAKEIALADFQSNLGKLIDKGNEIGVDVEFMNPLTAAMKALSENIITDQRAK